MSPTPAEAEVTDRPDRRPREPPRTSMEPVRTEQSLHSPKVMEVRELLRLACRRNLQILANFGEWDPTPRGSV